MQRTTVFCPFLVPVPRRIANCISLFAGLSMLIQRLPSAQSSSAGMVSAETKPIFQIQPLTAETVRVVFNLLASEAAVDFVPAWACIFFITGCLRRTTSETGTLQVMGSTVKDKRWWQHPHQACSRKVQCGNNGADRKALLVLFKAAIESFQFSNNFFGCFFFSNLLLRS